MITTEKKHQIRQSITIWAEANVLAYHQFEKTLTLLTIALELDDIVSVNNEVIKGGEPDQKNEELLSLDEDTFTVLWRGRKCFLGNTLLFHFLSRLSKSCNRYVSYSELLETVWGGHRENSTIRGIAKRLREKLTSSGMKTLAQAINGKEPGHYGLFLV